MKYPSNKIVVFAVLLSLLTVTGNLTAQTVSPPRAPVPVSVGPLDTQADWVTKIFETKNIDANVMKSILAIFRADLVVPGVYATGGRSKLISVHAPKEIMPAIEETIARFDVPPPPQEAITPVKSIEVSVQVLGAYDGPAPSCATCAAMPQSLQPVITQLQKTFSYKNYLLLDTQFYRLNDRTSLNSVNSLAAMNDNSATYSLSWSRANASPDKSSIQLYSLKFGADVRMQGRDQNTHFGFDTSEVQIPVNQQIVVGKTTVGTGTVFLVIQAKVLD